MKPTVIVKSNQLATYQQAKIFAEYAAVLVSDFTAQIFDPEFWQAQQAILGSAQGRGTTWFIQPDTNSTAQWVLRHYYRGGLVGKLIHDSYWFSSITNTRAAREFHLLNKLQELELPAPVPVAYQIKRSGLCYRADIITERITDAQDLVAILSQQALPALMWQSIGKTIRAFHQQGIYHHDLNAHNILIDNNNKVWLIDFDQGEQRPIKAKWQQQNRQRLLRSLRKEQAKINNWAWCEQDWQALLDGYNSQ